MQTQKKMLRPEHVSLHPSVKIKSRMFKKKYRSATLNKHNNAYIDNYM